ncbi:hypothetical protein Pyn_17977 [Prunus yedoensis var. nudiflora]|uniref:DUF7788 domain-containing protein n=1 Tax=Prunus yedoensis var. nudiflora TaxID=2094558 RepID=A0A314ZRU6_PRUYE|nr:hypothetical protein Pyn_17977 [Prunus yedoensis var. nudiflora]
MEIDFRKVFDMILQVAVDGNLRLDQIGKKVSVLTRLENFDRAGGSCWEDYEALQKNLQEKGYGDAVPHIVFWHLDPYEMVPVSCHRRSGVAVICASPSWIMMGKLACTMSWKQPSLAYAIDDGFCTMIGEGPGAGYNINVPRENGRCGDADYFVVWDRILVPDLIILSAGFDGAWSINHSMISRSN